MNIQLIQGDFNHQEGLDIISKMIQLKISYHESKISSNTNEEDIKFRESKIKRLQSDLMQLRSALQGNDNLHIESNINIE